MDPIITCSWCQGTDDGPCACRAEFMTPGGCVVCDEPMETDGLCGYCLSLCPYEEPQLRDAWRAGILWALPPGDESNLAK